MLNILVKSLGSTYPLNGVILFLEILLIPVYPIWNDYVVKRQTATAKSPDRVWMVINLEQIFFWCLSSVSERYGNLY